MPGFRTGAAIAAVVGLFFLAGCATGPRGSDAVALSADLAGPYDNTTQWAQMPEGFRATSGVTPVEVRFVRIETAALAPGALYEEWRSADAARTPLRQRIWSIRPDGPGFRVERYHLKAPARALGAGADAFLTLTANDLEPMGVWCALRLAPSGANTWDAQSPTNGCVGKDGQIINTRITRTPGGVLYSETSGRIDPGGAPTPFDLRRR